MANYSGTYDGVVVNNRDPLNQQRVTVYVPQVLGGVESNWADPSAPTAFVPSTNDSVLVQFVGGDPAKPVYVAHGLTDLNTNVNQAQTTASNAQSTANAAQSTANSAQSAAATAQSTANGKNTVYYAATAPTGGTYKTNDVWYDTSNGYLLNMYINGAWTPSALGHQAIQNIDAATITVGQITGAQISATAIDGKTITGATFQSAQSGHRWVLSSTPANSFQGFAGTTETTPGSVTVDGDPGPVATPNPASWVTIQSGQYNQTPNVYSALTLQTAGQDTNPRPGRQTAMWYYSHQHFFSDAINGANAGNSGWNSPFIVDAQANALTANTTLTVHNGEVVGAGNNIAQFRAKPTTATGAHNAALLIRNDGGSTYFLMTDDGNPDGSWSSTKSYPIIIDNGNGRATISANDVSVAGRSLPRGYVSGTYKAITANTPTYTAMTKVAGLSLTATLDSTRQYKWTVAGLCVNTSGTFCSLSLRMDGTEIQEGNYYINNASYSVGFSIPKIVTGSSAAHTFDVYVVGALVGGSTYRTEAYLEDLGPQ